MIRLRRVYPIIVWMIALCILAASHPKPRLSLVPPPLHAAAE